MKEVVKISESGLQDRPRTQALIYFAVGASARSVRCNIFSRPVLAGNFVDTISQSWEITICNYINVRFQCPFRILDSSLHI